MARLPNLTVSIEFPQPIHQVDDQTVEMQAKLFEGPIFSETFSKHVVEALGEAEYDDIVDEIVEDVFKRSLFKRTKVRRALKTGD